MPRIAWVAIIILGGGLALLLVNDSSDNVLGFDNSQFARIISLAAIGIVVGAGILSSRNALSQAARNVAIWLFLALALVGGYQSRYELQDVASRLTAGLVPGSPLSLGSDGGRATVSLEKMTSGHFELRAEVNGAPVWFIVDTGATSTVLTESDARSAGIDTGRLDFSVPVQTANGTTRAALTRNNAIRVGDIERDRVSVLVAADGDLQQSLLGMNFIGSLSGFDMRGNRLILRD